MKILKGLTMITLLTPLVLFLFTYIHAPSVRLDERVMYLQMTYWYPTLEYLGLWG